MNDGISLEKGTVKYCSMGTVVDKIWEVGKGALLFKIDLERAYRVIPIRIEDRRLLSIEFENKFYVDATLPLEDGHVRPSSTR